MSCVCVCVTRLCSRERCARARANARLASLIEKAASATTSCCCRRLAARVCGDCAPRVRAAPSRVRRGRAQPGVGCFSLKKERFPGRAQSVLLESRA